MGQFPDGTRQAAATNLVKPVLSLTSQEISQEHAALLKNRLYRRWGIKAAREYARIKIDGLGRLNRAFKSSKSPPPKPGLGGGARV